MSLSVQPWIWSALAWTFLAPNAQATETFHYGWPDSGQVVLEVQRLSIERRVATRWTLRWAPHQGETRFEVVDPQLIGLFAAGRELSLTSSLGESVLALESVLPAWEVGPAGEFRGIDGDSLDRSVAKALDRYRARVDSTQALFETTLATLTSEGLRLQSRQRIRQAWRAWVSEWRAMPVEAGWVGADSVSVLYRNESLRGERLRQVEALPHLRGFALAHLRSSFSVEGRRSEILQARVEVATLRPLRASLRVSVPRDSSAVGPDVPELYEEELFTFRWPGLPAR